MCVASLPALACPAPRALCARSRARSLRGWPPFRVIALSHRGGEEFFSSYFLDGHLRCREMRWKLGGQVPGQEFVDTVDRMIGDALQDMA